MTQVVREAIALEDMVDERVLQGKGQLVIESDGKRTEIVIPR